MHLHSVMESFFHPWPDPFPQALGQGVHHPHPPQSSNGALTL
ncbi:unnamed protein product [Gulo gulo]|uniref:Uncharacterized protein n=1 Tax=Gulo gulo TaxID=48420 RepID=A0A9X9LLD9_GULGU|nr:unnamed protein product [Gulo gulo]